MLVFGGDEVVKPTHFALDFIKAMALQFEGVRVYAFAGPSEVLAHERTALGEPHATALQDGGASTAIRASEEGEVHPEAIVIPSVRPGIGEQGCESQAAGFGDGVRDAIAAGVGGAVRGGGASA